MDINALPTGTRCLVDSNILIYHLAGLSQDCRNFLHRVVNGEVEACLTTVIIAEILHRRMMAEALSKGLVSAGKVLAKLKANPAVITQLTDYLAEVEKLLRLPLKVIEASTADIASSHHLRLTHGLFVNDSINLACAVRYGITNIISHDNDFARVTSITVWDLTDV